MPSAETSAPLARPGRGARFEILLPIRAEEAVRDERVLESGSWHQPPELRGHEVTPSEGNNVVASADQEE